MRIAVVSDTHMPRGARALPQHCVERLLAADLILHAGDLVTVAFLEELRRLGPPVEAVCGNVDEPALRELLPARRTVEVGEVRIGMLHVPGPRAGLEKRLAGRFPGCDAVVYGHTHLPRVERYEGMWILNPGSPTERRRAPVRTMLELAVEGRTIRPELVDLGT
jgi:putative phosphoesterase